VRVTTGGAGRHGPGSVKPRPPLEDALTEAGHVVSYRGLGKRHKTNSNYGVRFVVKTQKKLNEFKACTSTLLQHPAGGMTGLRMAAPAHFRRHRPPTGPAFWPAR